MTVNIDLEKFLRTIKFGSIGTWNSLIKNCKRGFEALKEGIESDGCLPMFGGTLIFTILGSVVLGLIIMVISCIIHLIMGLPHSASIAKILMGLIAPFALAPLVYVSFKTLQAGVKTFISFSEKVEKNLKLKK